MQADKEIDGFDELRAIRAELAAALRGGWDWSCLDPDWGVTSQTVGESFCGSTPPSASTPAPPGSVPEDVAGANVTSQNDGIDAGPALGSDSTSSKQLRIGLPNGFAKGLSMMPERLRSHVFLAAVIVPLGGKHSPAEFVAAAIQLERAGNILRHALHLGLPAGIAVQVRRLCRWIGQACNLRRDDREPSRLRLTYAHAIGLQELKPRTRDEFVRLVLSFARAGISVSGVASEEFRIRIASDCIAWHLEADPESCPVAEIVPLLDVLADLQQGGAS